MQPITRHKKSRRFSCGRAPRCCFIFILTSILLLSACGELGRPVAEPFYAEATPPPIQEFRWSNGKMPRTLDPARAAAPPETDVTRAIYDGLTEVDPATLREMPAIAERWTSSEDKRTWTFYLRADAKWSNGKPLTAHDFVRSWERLGALGDAAAHRNLLDNFAGNPASPSPPSRETPAVLTESITESLDRAGKPLADTANSNAAASAAEPSPSPTASPRQNTNTKLLPGVTAIDELTLKVELVIPDKDLPKLVANPVFRPIYENTEFDSELLNQNAVTSGAFRIVSVEPGKITLAKSDSYWNRDSIHLERVVFVAKENAEQALQAYRAGEVDAVTNVEFAPLALKLLEPYEDFRRATHSALNFFEINHRNAPFSDRRVREALAIGIERERLTEGALDGAFQPAYSFLPFGGSGKTPGISQDKEKARDLLNEAGFPEGENFPVIRLVVNRNDLQQRVARSVARMWKQNLNLETDIIVKETGELEEARRLGDFDLVRRNVVLPTADETANFLAIFGSNKISEAVENEVTVIDPRAKGTPDADPTEQLPPDASPSESEIGDALGLILNEQDALYELHAIPLYFPTSYSLVKPYVSGFELNSLDAPLLQGVSIDKNWQPNKRIGES